MMKNQIKFFLLLIIFFNPYFLYSQLNLDVEGDGTISGRLGVGTMTPTDKLEVQGADAITRITASTITPHNAALRATTPNSDFAWFSGGDINLFRLFDFNANAVRVAVDSNGNIGVGTSAPLGRFNIPSMPDVTLTQHGGITLGTEGNINISMDENEIQARNNGAPSAFFINREGGNIICGISSETRLGIGTTFPAASLDVNGTIKSGEIITDQAKIAINEDGTGNRVSYLDFYSTDGINNYSSRIMRLAGNNGELLIDNNGAGAVQINTNGVKRMEILGNGEVHVSDKLVVTGSDFAERFPINSPNKKREMKGLLMVIDEEQEGHLTPCSMPYDKKVAGIVSGAGGVSTGMVMGEPNTLADGDTPVAMSGRVYCYADASYGPISVGDLLTTSATEGHAMKAKRFKKSQGAVIGKAMTSLKEGCGLVLVLINAQ